jgi:putative endonuclease
MDHTVYILYSPSRKTVYIGYTSNLIERFHSHNIYGHGWTKRFRPWIIIYTEHFENKSAATIREKQLKSGKGREWIWNKINTELKNLGFISA